MIVHQKIAVGPVKEPRFKYSEFSGWVNDSGLIHELTVPKPIELTILAIYGNVDCRENDLANTTLEAITTQD